MPCVENKQLGLFIFLLPESARGSGCYELDLQLSLPVQGAGLLMCTLQARRALSPQVASYCCPARQPNTPDNKMHMFTAKATPWMQCVRLRGLVNSIMYLPGMWGMASGWVPAQHQQRAITSRLLADTSHFGPEECTWAGMLAILCLDFKLLLLLYAVLFGAPVCRPTWVAVRHGAGAADARESGKKLGLRRSNER